MGRSGGGGRVGYYDINNLMEEIPRAFVTFCRISGMSDERTVDAWKKLWEKVENEWEEKVATGNILKEEQITQLEKIVPGSDKKVTELLMTVLDGNQKQKGMELLGQVVADNLSSFYSNIKDTMSMEQRQVADSFIKVSN